MNSAGKLLMSGALLIILSSFSGNFTIGCYTSIFSFGDSLSDTGNSLHLFQSIGYHVNSGSLPFGQTYFHHPTGRFSDGRIIIDFIAQHLGLELIPPYFGEGGKFNQDISMQGINFAVGGSTAMDDSFFDQKGIHEPYKNVSLVHQLTWFKQLLPSHCHQSPASCKEIFKSSLFLLGEIGGNDYNHAFSDGRSFDEIQTFVDPVIHSISNAITELIEIGADTLIVPGNLPIGCNFIYLNIFSNSSKDPETGCIVWLNDFSQSHNHKLQTELDRIRQHYPHTTIIYADYYNSAMEIYRNPREFGFKEGELGPCCGEIDKLRPQNTVEKYLCDGPKTKTCGDPSEFINWDGTHLTEAAYKWIFKGLLKDYSYPPMKSLLCISDI